MEQRSEEWFQARLGKVTASRVADVLAKIKSGESASRRNYKIQLVSERLTGEKQETYINQAMQDGIDREVFARDRYIQQFGEVEEVGFIKHPIWKLVLVQMEWWVMMGLLKLNALWEAHIRKH